MLKKRGPKLKKGISITKLYLDRLLYAELARISVIDHTPIHQLLNEGMDLRLDKYPKDLRKRNRDCQKAALERARKERLKKTPKGGKE